MRRPVAGAVAALALVVPSASATEKPPKVGEVDYFKQSGEQGPVTNLEVFFRHTPDSVKLKARFEGDKARAKGREYKPIDSPRYGHPWIPDHNQGRRALLDVMKRSIAETGAVTLKVVASNDAGKTRTRVEIVYSHCRQEPPLYPFTCQVEP